MSEKKARFLWGPAGFRLSPVDGLFIALGAGATWLLRDYLGRMVWILPAETG